MSVAHPAQVAAIKNASRYSQISVGTEVRLVENRWVLGGGEGVEKTGEMGRAMSYGTLNAD